MTDHGPGPPPPASPSGRQRQGRCGGRPRPRPRTDRAQKPYRIGLFGYLGSGNIGNDASMESVLAYLRSAHPEAVIDVMGTGPEQINLRYGLEAEPLFWYLGLDHLDRGAAAVAIRIFSKIIDVARIAAWVRRHDAVIVPGMGVLETTLPLHAFGAPYAMFVMCASGRLFGTKVALASVGANVIRQPLIRWLYHRAAKLAAYVSYRDAGSMAAMPPRKGDATIKRIYPDVAFGLPVPTGNPVDQHLVGVGVMDFHGTNDERGQAAQIYARYVDTVTSFVLWLADTGHQVMLFVGDTKAGSDVRVVDEILAQVPVQRPELAPGRITAAAVESFGDLMDVMAPASAIVATRYHNLICALHLGKPTISLSYAAKHDTLMSAFGLAKYSQHAATLDLDRLIEQFSDLTDRSAELRRQIGQRNSELAREVAGQFAALSAFLFPAPAGQRADAVRPMTATWTAEVKK
jgi:polysaccharide pyruvyl transferase WcaK-like protein